MENLWTKSDSTQLIETNTHIWWMAKMAWKALTCISMSLTKSLSVSSLLQFNTNTCAQNDFTFKAHTHTHINAIGDCHVYGMAHVIRCRWKNAIYLNIVSYHNHATHRILCAITHHGRNSLLYELSKQESDGGGGVGVLRHRFVSV